jgi:hypothetical protein
MRRTALGRTLLVVSLMLVPTIGVVVYFNVEHAQTPVAQTSPVAAILATLSTPTNTCGSWATSSQDATQMAISSKYGPIARCELIGDTWVLMTAGVANPPADNPTDPPPEGSVYTQRVTILTDSCSASDSTCLSASAPHPISSWRSAEAPSLGFYKPVDLYTPTVLVILSSNGQLLFNTRTNAWFQTPSSTLVACNSEWGGYQSTQLASSPSASDLSLEQSFVISNPQCSSAGA